MSLKPIVDAIPIAARVTVFTRGGHEVSGYKSTPTQTISQGWILWLLLHNPEDRRFNDIKDQKILAVAGSSIEAIEFSPTDWEGPQL